MTDRNNNDDNWFEAHYTRDAASPTALDDEILAAAHAAVRPNRGRWVKLASLAATLFVGFVSFQLLDLDPVVVKDEVTISELAVSAQDVAPSVQEPVAPHPVSQESKRAQLKPGAERRLATRRQVMPLAGEAPAAGSPALADLASAADSPAFADAGMRVPQPPALAAATEEESAESCEPVTNDVSRCITPGLRPVLRFGDEFRGDCVAALALDEQARVVASGRTIVTAGVTNVTSLQCIGGQWLWQEPQGGAIGDP